MKTILHVDMDAFFASVEVLDNPSLLGKPVIVGSPPESRGVVAAASYEARKFGIHSAMSSYRALKLCPSAVLIKPRMERYCEISSQIRAIFLSYTPLVEPISIDEAFLDVTGSEALFGTGIEIARAIQARIKDELHLAASVGVAPNKFLAKLASDLEKPNGLVVITHETAEAILFPLPVSKLWGVGKVTQQELASINVHKVKDLFTCPRPQLEELLGSYTDTLLELAQGQDDREIVTEGEQKSIGAETTFPQDISDRPLLQKKLSILVERVSRELRETGLKARTINIKARFADFTTITRAQTLPAPTSSTRTIKETAHDLLLNRVAQKPLRLIGVSVSNLITPGEGQQELFLDEDEEKEDAIDRAKDELQDRFGPNALRSGVELTDPP
jgi:DNA polymerase-4